MATNNSHYNICSSFSKNPKRDFTVYAKGYLNAANSLTNDLVQRENYADYEGYPIFFLYRHALELGIKNIIYWCIELSNFSDKQLSYGAIYESHQLLNLSETMMQFLKAIEGKQNSSLNEVEKVLEISKTITKLDPGSYSYRYPVNKQGNESTEKNQTFNLKLLSDDVNDCIRILDFTYDYLSTKYETLTDIIANHIDFKTT